ncbi:MAG: hypothetical protein ACK4MQ_11405 [Hyphomonas sp.]
MTSLICNSMRLVALAGFAMLTALQASATPPCSPIALTVRADRIATYMPFNDQAEILNIRVDGSAKSACRATLRFSSGTGGGLLLRASRLDILFRTPQGRRLDPRSEDQFSITLLPATANSVSADLIAVLPPRQSVAAGLYEGAFELEVVSPESGDQRAAFSIGALVASQADIRLAGQSSGSSGQGVDFGVLEKGREETAFVSVRSSGAYTVELESMNHWFLERAGWEAPDAKIAYSIWFNDYSVPRHSVARVPQIYEPTGQKGKLGRLRFRVGDTAGKPAGLYQDTVRITVVLLE